MIEENHGHRSILFFLSLAVFFIVDSFDLALLIRGGFHRMFEQRGEEGREAPMVAAYPEERRLLDASLLGDGFRCYSLEVLRLLED